jgi:cobalt/nickel transport protein
MKKYLMAIGLIAIFLAVFVPFASRSPDGLERVAATLGIEEQAPIWKGLMSDYSVAIIDNPYISTLIAGIFGTLVVLGLSLALGKAVVLKKGADNS